MRGFVALHVRPLFRQPLRAILSISGIAVGIALLISMLGLFSSMSTAADRLANLAGSADIEVSAPNDAGLPATVADEVANVDGVKVVAPVVRTNVVLNDLPVLLLGADGRLQQIGGGGLDLGACLPKALRAGEGVLVGPALANAKTARLTTATGSSSVNILGRITCRAAQKLNTGSFVFAPLAVAELLGGHPGQPDAIEIKAAAGVNRVELSNAIEHVVGGRAVVASPQLLAQQGKDATNTFKQGTSVMVGLALVVGAFCVFNTVSMTALERRRELATLRAIGGHRRKLLRDFLLEMTMIGVIGSAVGVVLGAQGGRYLIGRVPPILVDTVGVRPTFVLEQRMVVIAIVLGTLVTVGAAVLPARHAVTVEPVEAMRSEGPSETAVVPYKSNIAVLIAGLVVFAGGSIAAWTGTSNGVTLIGFSAITVGSLIAQYGGRAWTAELTAWVASKFGNSGRLAATAIAQAPRRTWATVTAVTVAVITVVAMGGITSNQIQTFTGPYEAMKATDVWVGSADTDVIPVNVRFPDSVLDDVRNVDGVATVVGTQSTYTTIGTSRVLLQGVDGMANSAQFASLPLDAKRRLLDASHPVATATRAFADHHHVHAGDTLTLTTPSGPLALPLIKVVDTIAPTQSGVVNINLAVLQHAYARLGVTWIEAMAKPGVSRDVLKARITRALANSPTPAFVSTGEEAYAGARNSVVQSTRIITAMEVAVFAGTALALGNALLISVIERRRELGIIRAIGTTRRQIRQMILIEAGAVATIGVALGSFQGLAQHRVGDTAVETLLNARMHYSFTLNPLLAVSGAMLVIALLVALAPAIRAGRTNVIEAIGYE